MAPTYTCVIATNRILSLFSVWYAEESDLKRAQERFGQIGCPGEPTETDG